ncbi:MAG: competence/damage-inducible protein A [Acidobacteria bacterium]|nr:competence/damage-inducible protein A [Acidobacteriota bacterium]
MDAAIIAIGSEMLTPDRVDTNSLWLTDQLNTRGVEVTMKMIVGDDRERLVRAMRHALDEVDLLFLSGGLGPTEDDVTRDAVAELCLRPLVFSQDICDWLVQRFERMKRKMAEVNKRQAFVVEGADVLPNERGTAPGQWVEYSGKHVVLLPGPPHEFKAMFTAQCVHRLEPLLPKQVIRTRFYRVACMGESDLDQLIAPVYKPYTNPATTILAAAADIQIHLRARCPHEDEAEALLFKVAGPILDLLGDRVYSDNGDPLETVIGHQLRAQRKTLAVAESATGGMLAERITSIPGSSDYFAGGFLTYTYHAKSQLLGIDPAFLEQHKAVSEPVAEAMARCARERTGASVALAVTGIAGPGAGSESEPVGTMFIGLSAENHSSVRRYHFSGDRHRIRTLATQFALDLLRRHLRLC